jgi:flagellar biosynthesis component FlhA
MEETFTMIGYISIGLGSIYLLWVYFQARGNETYRPHQIATTVSVVLLALPLSYFAGLPWVIVIFFSGLAGLITYKIPWYEERNMQDIVDHIEDDHSPQEVEPNEMEQEPTWADDTAGEDYDDSL